jgi:HD-like signal output (HDOD) protein
MAAEVSREEVERILQGISIPPRPSLLGEVDRELGKAEPDLRRTATLISKDVALSAAVLKTLNSPLFALRSKVANIAQAVMLLGVSNTRNVITGLLLRGSLGGAAASLERFWDSAEKIASINAYICTRLPRAPREEAYTFGLFRDCGIPLLMQRFPDYRETLLLAANHERSLADVERVRHGTTHNAVGGVIARNWGLSDPVCQAIHNHHRPMIVGRDDTPPLVKTLVAVNFLAEHIIETTLHQRPDPMWEAHAGAVLDYLNISDDRYYEIEENALAMFD